MRLSFWHDILMAGSSDSIALPAPEVHERTSRCLLFVDRPKSPQTQLLIGQLGVSRSHPDYIAIEMMNLLLGGMFSSRINHNLREVHGYTYGANSQFTYRRGLGPFLISAAIRTDATAAAIGEVLHEIERLRQELATADELAVAREALTRSLISRFDTAGSSSAAISELFVHGLDLHYFRKAMAQVSQVTASDIQRVANAHLDPGSMVVVVVGDDSRIKNEINQLDLGPLYSVGICD